MQQTWYGGSAWYLPFLPFSWVFGLVVRLRATLYRAGILRSYASSVPVVVVGNITIGGTGKTPFTIWLAEKLLEHGQHPVIISRGYGGKVGKQPILVTEDTDPGVAGDEPVLIALRSACPVVVHPDRVRAANIAEKLGATVIIADDGLQHYRLQRDYEIALIDGMRGFGNERLLPAETGDTRQR